MERLTKRDEVGKAYCPYCEDACCDEPCIGCDFDGLIIEKLASYEDLEEEGRLRILPCKIGDTAYALRRYGGKRHIQQGIVSEMFFTKEMKLLIVVRHVARGEYGKDVFLTMEEAERHLKK